MARLIDADNLKKDIAKLHVLHDEKEIRRLYYANPHTSLADFEEILVRIFDAIEAAPSIEPKRGEWVFKTIFPNDKSEFPMGYLVCSVCGSHHSNSTPCNYCDNCGARMKGADDE